jgi:hypothetical protein
MAERRPWYTVLCIQTLIAIFLGILMGILFPAAGDGGETAG